MKPTKSEIYEIAAELEQGIERTGVTSPFMEALIQAAALLEEMDESQDELVKAANESSSWLDISEAPRGEWVLVAVPTYASSAKVTKGYFSEINDCWWAEDCITELHGPTHFQHLPQPPTEDNQKEIREDGR